MHVRSQSQLCTSTVPGVAPACGITLRRRGITQPLLPVSVSREKNRLNLLSVAVQIIHDRDLVLQLVWAIPLLYLLVQETCKFSLRLRMAERLGHTALPEMQSVRIICWLLHKYCSSWVPDLADDPASNSIHWESTGRYHFLNALPVVPATVILPPTT